MSIAHTQVIMIEVCKIKPGVRFQSVQVGTPIRQGPIKCILTSREKIKIRFLSPRVNTSYTVLPTRPGTKSGNEEKLIEKRIP